LCSCQIQPASSAAPIELDPSPSQKGDLKSYEESVAGSEIPRWSAGNEKFEKHFVEKNQRIIRRALPCAQNQLVIEIHNKKSIFKI
jgi:hypothetical protein